MRTIPCYQVDAFTRRPFHGNPAAVCPLPGWLPDEVMQAIAAENALSETAFFVPEGEGYGLRWMTPEVEVDLCGHATLATAFVLATILDPDERLFTFHTRSGLLSARREEDDVFVLDFPSRPPETSFVPGLADALGNEPSSVALARDAVAVFDSAEEVRALRPDFAKLAELACYAVIATARGTGADDDVDFVSRFFAPRQGIAEDPVTGSAHTTLAPYWAARLGRDRLRARQVSRREGEIACTVAGDRVLLAGHAVLVKRGELLLPA